MATYISHIFVIVITAAYLRSPYTSSGHEETLEVYYHSENELADSIYPQPLTPEHVEEMFNLEGLITSEINLSAKEQYFNAWEQIDAGPGQIIKGLAEATIVNPKDSGRPDFIPTPDVLRLIEAREKAFALATQADDILFQEIMANQSTLIQIHIRSIQYKRRAELHQINSILPGSLISLREIINALKLNKNVREVIQLTMSDYERQRATCIVDRWKRLNELDISKIRLHIQLGPMWQHTQSSDQKALAFEELRRIDTERIQAEFPLRDLNTQFIQRISKVLPPPISMEFISTCNASIYPKIHLEMYALKQLSTKLSTLSGIEPKDRQAITERVLFFEEKNSRLLSKVQQLAENRYRIEYRNSQSITEEFSQSELPKNRSESLELLDADYAYLQEIISLRNRQIKIAGELRGALPIRQETETTTQRGLELITEFIEKSEAKNRRDEWRIDQHFESARLLMTPAGSN